MAKPPSSTATDPASPLWKRLAWFAGLWAAGAGITAGAAYVLRALLLL